VAEYGSPARPIAAKSPVQPSNELVPLSHMHQPGSSAEWANRLTPRARRRAVHRKQLGAIQMIKLRSALFSVTILASFLLTLAAPFRWF
jgi:hypothetical protein